MENRFQEWLSNRSVLVVFSVFEALALGMFVFVAYLGVWQSEIIMGVFSFLVNPLFITLHFLSKRWMDDEAKRRWEKAKDEHWNYKIPQPKVIILPASLSLTQHEKELFALAEEATKDIRCRKFDWSDEMDAELCEATMNEHTLMGDKPLTDLAHAICRAWGIRDCEELRVHEEQYVDIDPSMSGAIGKFEGPAALISLRFDPHFALAYIVRALAHECMHYYMWRKQIFISNDHGNEFFVEAALTISGFYEYVKDCSMAPIKGERVVLGYVDPWKMVPFLEEAQNIMDKRKYGDYWDKNEIEKEQAYMGFISDIKACLSFLKDKRAYWKILASQVKGGYANKIRFFLIRRVQGSYYEKKIANWEFDNLYGLNPSSFEMARKTAKRLFRYVAEAKEKTEEAFEKELDNIKEVDRLGKENHYWGQLDGGIYKIIRHKIYEDSDYLSAQVLIYVIWMRITDKIKSGPEPEEEINKA